MAGFREPYRIGQALRPHASKNRSRRFEQVKMQRKARPRRLIVAPVAPMTRSTYIVAAVLLVSAWLLQTRHQGLRQLLDATLATNPWITDLRESIDAFIFLPISNKPPPLAGHGGVNVEGIFYGEVSATRELDPTCVALNRKFPEIAHLPGSVDFYMPPDAYWTAQAASLTASCVIRPRNATEVGEVVQVLKTVYDAEQSGAVTFDRANGAVSPEDDQGQLYKLRFAVKSGGHSVEAGFASIDSGILLDLVRLNTVQVSPDQQTATIGVGARWGTVYDKLAEAGLTVVGGRDSHVGVGGYILGGGISYFSPRYGMACDNVVEYEIILADGRLVRATALNEHVDLWRVLKGGGGNFGIVTSIVAETFPSTQIWSGNVYWAAFSSTIDQLLNAMHNLLKPETFDDHAAGPIVMLAYVKLLGFGVSLAASSVVYTKPEPWPAIWQPFRSIRRLWSTTKIQSLSETSNEMMQLSPFGHRRYMITMTIKNDLATLKGIHAIWKQKRITDVAGTISSLVMQPLSSKIIHKSSAANNVLGLSSRNTTDQFVIIMMSHTYALKRDDSTVYRRMQHILAEMESFARSKGTYDPYVYLNYAASGQDVFGGYGEENRQFMLDVSRKYDPDRFWQVAKKGGFKIEPELGSTGKEAEDYYHGH